VRKKKKEEERRRRKKQDERSALLHRATIKSPSSLYEDHHTTPQPFYGPFSGTTRESWCQKSTSGLYGAR